MSTQSSYPRKLRHRLLTLAALTAALSGCASWWNLGPRPDNFIGKGGSEQLLTDPNMKAVIPHVEGDGKPSAYSATAPYAMPGAATTPSTTAPATATSPAQNAAAAPVPESLSVQEAILTGLEHNINLRIQRVNVPKSRTAEEQALAAFDPTVSGSLQGGRTVSGGRPVDSVNGSLTVNESLPTGTSIQAGVTTSNSFYSESASTTSGKLTVTQALLRGAGLDVNLASVRSAELSTRITQYQLRGVAESLVASIEESYWDLAYAEEQMKIVQNALDVAERQLEDTRTRVRVQRVAESELPAAEAEVANRRENLINAESSLKTQRLKFLQLLSPASRDFATRTVELTTAPFTPQGTMDPVDTHVDAAMKFRPDLNQARLQVQRGDLEIVRTRNGLLPKLDLFVTLGKTGFSSSFGDSISRSFDGTDYQAILGVQGDWEPINRSAKASYRSAELSLEQLKDTLDNQRQLAELDVRTQYLEVERTRKQIDATQATLEAQQATVDVQKGKLDAGSGTVLLWTIAERDLLSAQLAKEQAKTNHLKALVELYRLEGTLLFRRGLAAPGAAPVESTVYTPGQ
jgi:outer membrane protein